MYFISFNINSIRARMHQLAALVDQYQPCVIGLQETKVHDDEFPVSDVEALGLHVIYHGQKGHYGVAICSSIKPTNVVKGFPTDSEESQKRFIGAEYDIEGIGSCWLYNGYYPQGDNIAHESKFPAKQKYYRDLTAFLTDTHDMQKQHVVVMGDNNIAYNEADIGIGADNAKRWLRSGKASFQPVEREWFKALLATGLSDTSGPMKDTFTWFDYRSKGFDREPKRGLRIDYILASDPLKQQVLATGVDYQIRAMEKPSDHAPIWCQIA